jgi:hypothetical protein
MELWANARYNFDKGDYLIEDLAGGNDPSVAS